MRSQRNTLLASIAALALLAGTGFASAQDTGKNQNGATGQQNAATQQQMNKRSSSGKMGQNAQQQSTTHGKMGKTAQGNKGYQGSANKGAPGTQGYQANAGKSAQNEGRKTGKTHMLNQQAQGQQHAGKTTTRTAQTMQHKHGMTRAQTTAEHRKMSAQKSTLAQREHKGTAGLQRNAQRQRKGFEGLQGNAAATNVKLNEEQRSRIRTTVIDARGAPKVGHVNFAVRVGTVVPRGAVRIVPVPETLVRINPAWRGLLYFVYENEIVLVNPRTMRIVAVVYA
jgi:hypothetical protein